MLNYILREEEEEKEREIEREGGGGVRIQYYCESVKGGKRGRWLVKVKVIIKCRRRQEGRVVNYCFQE